MADVALSVLAHPDDAEFLCAGSLIRLIREHGWEVHIASMTPGDCGSAELPPEEISHIRRAEGTKAAELVGGRYHCLEERDLLIFYNERALERVTRLFRELRPRIVFTHSPADYMLDHEMTSTVVRAAAFAAPIPNFLADRWLGPVLEHIPHLYYCDPIEGKDALGRDVEPAFRIDVSGVIDTKAEMLAAHASQREWLLKHHGIDHYVASMRDWGARRGREAGVAFAECKRLVPSRSEDGRPRRIASLLAHTGFVLLIVALYTTVPPRRSVYGVFRPIGPDAPLTEALERSRGPLLELPAQGPWAEAASTYRSIFHRRPLLNGYSGYWPAGYAERMALARRLPDPAAVRELERSTGLRQIVVHTAGYRPEERRVWIELADRGGDATLALVAREDKRGALGDFDPRLSHRAAPRRSRGRPRASPTGDSGGRPRRSSASSSRRGTRPRAA